jgi:uncharacterized membrane protein YfcA
VCQRSARPRPSKESLNKARNSCRAKFKSSPWKGCCARNFRATPSTRCRRAFGGSSLSKIVNGQKLLVFFAILMMIVAAVMFARRSVEGEADVTLSRQNLPKLLGSGLLTGALSGFFGIGGGFLIVPALMFATGMPIINAIGSSLLAVAAFGATAAFNYARSGLVDWRLAVIFIAGGVGGGLAGGRVARLLGERRGALNILFAGIIVLVAIYMLVRSILG